MIIRMTKIAQSLPCDFDHNGECLVCDCWISNCAYMRWKNRDYKYESEEELEKMFNEGAIHKENSNTNQP